AQRELVVVEAGLATDFRENIRRRFLLEHSAIDATRKQPERGAHDRAVLVKALAVAGIGKFGDDAVKVARLGGRARHLDRYGLTENRVGIGAASSARRVDAAQIEIEAKGPADLLDGREAREHEILHIARTGDADGTVLLIVGCHGVLKPRPARR